MTIHKLVQELPICFYYTLERTIFALSFHPPRFPVQFDNLSVLLLISLVITKELHPCSMKPAQLVPPQSTCQEESFDSAREKMDFLDRLLISLSPAYTAWGKLIDPQSTDSRDREQQLNFYTKLILRIMPMFCGGVMLSFQLTQVFQFISYHL